MRHKLADSQYERLNHRERLMMVAQALARGDVAESRWLHDTTPTQAYRCADTEFDVPFRTLWQLVYILSIYLNRCIGQLDMAKNMGETVPLLMQLAWSEGAQKAIDMMEDNGLELAAESDGLSTVTEEEVTPQAEDTAISPKVGLVAYLGGKAQSCFTEVHEIIMEQVASEAAAMLMSFDHFTRLVLGLDGMTVLRAWMPPVADDVERLGIQNYQPTARRLEEWGQVWACQWNRRMGRILD